jgi:hypothetical protein
MFSLIYKQLISVLFMIEMLINNNFERKCEKVVVALPYLYWPVGTEEIRIVSVLDVTGNLPPPPQTPPKEKTGRKECSLLISLSL